ncbi:TM2 domain-containing protein [Carboxylicivirga caseinilyticus]|uniref:TM2 domain-containing protein n=1 Tax=Carboxylicivirga caseinilyticus TaxID=3417572 RepID=UPI003D33A574|nr:TM2 domain-containing protein [Marinilabiliaceae bacterium A049]
MNRIFTLLPEAESEEAIFLESLLKDSSDDQVQNFILIYRGRRKDPQTILLTALIGFLGVSGIHRFLVNQIGMGILYLLTGGLCMIGTIVDLVNHKNLAFEYNQRVAREIKMLI